MPSLRTEAPLTVTSCTGTSGITIALTAVSSPSIALSAASIRSRTALASSTFSYGVRSIAATPSSPRTEAPSTVTSCTGTSGISIASTASFKSATSFTRPASSLPTVVSRALTRPLRAPTSSSEPVEVARAEITPAPSTI